MRLRSSGFIVHPPRTCKKPRICSHVYRVLYDQTVARQLSLTLITSSRANEYVLSLLLSTDRPAPCLEFVMQLYFRPATVKMLSNLKVLTIAMLLKVIMRRVFTTTQWEALLLLILGGAVQVGIRLTHIT